MTKKHEGYLIICFGALVVICLHPWIIALILPLIVVYVAYKQHKPCIDMHEELEHTAHGHRKTMLLGPNANGYDVNRYKKDMHTDDVPPF